MQIKDWYTPEEVAARIMTLMRRQVTPKQRRILDFVGVDDDNDEKIQRKVYVQDDRQLANIRGFTDPSIALQDLETEEQVIQPFHVRNHFPFEKDSEFTTKRNGEWMISAEGMRHAIEIVLEPSRLNLMVYALLSMINDRQFAYEDEEIGQIVIPYEEHVGTLPDASTSVDSGTFDPYGEVREMRKDFYRATGQFPAVLFGSPATLGPWMDLAEVEAKFEPQQPSDPDRVERTYDQFQFAGLTFVVLYDEYPDQDGNLHPAIQEDYLSVMPAQVKGTGEPPLMFRKAQNDENEGDAAEPIYWMQRQSIDPWRAGAYMYDNFIPDVSKKGIVRNWKIKNV